MNFEEAYSAIDDAKKAMKKGDLVIRLLLPLMVWRLRIATKSEGRWSSCREALVALKAELKDFDARTREWK